MLTTKQRREIETYLVDESNLDTDTLVQILLDVADPREVATYLETALSENTQWDTDYKRHIQALIKSLKR